MAALKLAARLAGTTGTKCCCNPPVILECKTRSGTAYMCGYDEWASPSNPPKKYLTLVEDYANTYDGYCLMTCAGTSHKIPSSGGGCANDPGVHDSCGTLKGPYDYRHNGGGNLTITDTPTVRTLTHAYPWGGGGTIVLSDEDTDTDAEARIADDWGNWGKIENCATCCIASRAIRTSNSWFAWNVTASKFRVGITDGVEDQLYQVAVDYERRAIGDTEWVLVATDYFAVVSAPDPVVDPPVEPVAAHLAWPEYDVPQLAGYETRVTNARVYVP